MINMALLVLLFFEEEMLSSELLRTRIYRNGQFIIPEFVDPPQTDALILSNKLIKLLEVCSSSQASKTQLWGHVSQIESQYKDYKLVRGLLQILERRCTYRPSLKNYTSLRKKGERQVHQDTDTNKDLTNDAIALRREVFEESARVGFSLTKNERIKILEKIARKSGLALERLETIMWNDLDENQRLVRFETISAPELLVSYNLSLLQTLLFGATELQFYIEGGTSWKKVLRMIKRLGLMYDLRYLTRDMLDSKSEDDLIKRSGKICKYNERSNGILTCVVQGSTNMLKLTDRYGSAIAKLIPLIVFNKKWFLKAPILRRTVVGKVKQYNFEIDSERQLLFDLTEKSEYLHPKEQIEYYPDNLMIFDSVVEEKFAKKFTGLSTGWNLVREPDPLILSDHRAFIPDFMFEKYGKRVYFEIVGFWTEEYLKRKLSKIADLLITGSNKYFDTEIPDLIVAVNISNHLSQNATKVRIDSIFSKIIDAKKLLIYKKDEIPLGQLIQYLKKIESEMIEYYWRIHQENLTKELQNLTNIGNNKNYVISLDSVACKFGIPTESVLKALNQMYSIDDYGKRTEQDFVLLDSFLLSRKKVSEIDDILKRVHRLNDAMRLLTDNDIPEKCVTNLISKLGYDIIWKGIDLNDATISKRCDNQTGKQSTLQTSNSLE
jgi:uncharacterized protein